MKIFTKPLTGLVMLGCYIHPTSASFQEFEGEQITMKCLGATRNPNYQYLDANTSNGSVYLAPATTGQFTGTHWRVERHQDGSYSFRNLGATSNPNYQYLDANTSNGSVYLAPATTGIYTGTHWEPVLNGDGSYSFRCLGATRNSNYQYLDANTSNGPVYLAPATTGPYTGTHWEVRPSNYHLYATIRDFRYDQPLERLQQASMPVESANCMVIHNDSDATIRQAYSENIQRASNLTWRFDQNESLRFSDNFTVHVNANASIPGLAEVSADATNVFTWDWQRNTHESQGRTLTQMRAYALTQEITIPPRSHISATSMTRWARGVSLPFTATLEITANSDPNNNNQYGLANSRSVELYLRNENYPGSIIRRDANAVFLNVQGTCHVDTALDSYVATRTIE